jgi:hypothetical protein
MRELSHVELEMVEGGNPVAVGVMIGAGVIALAGLAVVAYGVYNNCSGSMEISSDGIKVEVTCPPKTN